MSFLGERVVRKALYVILGLMLAIPGAIIAISPIPLGFVLLGPGVVLLIMGSRHVRHWIRNRRARNGEINARIEDAEDLLPQIIADKLKLTRP